MAFRTLLRGKLGRVLLVHSAFKLAVIASRQHTTVACVVS